jgi:outer membrane receptor protein involved in Fe transport
MVMDGMTEEGVAFANVIAYETGTESMKDGTTTNDRGRFFIKDLPYGSYDVIISFVGFSDKKIENITISAEQRMGRVGRVMMDAGNDLEAVEVTAEKNEITFGLDKKTFNVEKQINTTGGTAEDVLKNIPSISFDVDGNISLRGTSNVRILINGKPSALTGSGRQAVLDQIPAGSIKDVEVMTNPNAKYSPEGMGGVINIITKKQNKAGFNTRVALNVGTRNKYDGNISLNWRVGKFNFFSSYAGRQGEYFRDRTSNRTQTLTDTSFVRNTNSFSNSTRTSHNIKGGLEYFFSPQTTMTATVTANPSSRTQTSDANTDFLNDVKQLTDKSIRIGGGNETEIDMEYDLSFRKRFKTDGQELTMSGRYSTSQETEFENDTENFQDLTGFTYNTFAYETVEDENSQRIRGQIDYVHPFENKMKLETGFQTEIQKIDNDFDYTGLDELSSSFQLDNRFIYDEQIYALYGIMSGEKGKFGWSGGLRAEQVYVTAELADEPNSVFNNPYFRLYPSGSASYKLSEKSTLQASYSRRVNRPRSRSLNPFTQIRDTLNFSRGNPRLLPEFINSYEVNYLTFTPKGTFSVGAYYRQTNDIISRIQDVESQPGKIISTWANLTSGKSYGLEIVGTYRIKKWARFSANANIYRSVIDGSNIETDLANSGYLASGRVSANFTMWKDFSVQIASFMRSKGVSVQGTYEPIFSMDIALKKEILKGKGAITFRVSDPLDTRDFEININRSGLDQYLRFKRESRIAFLGFSYSLRQEKRKRGGNRGQRGGGGGGGGGDIDF